MNVPEDHYDGEKWFDNQGRPGVWRKTWDSYGGHWVMEFKRTNEFDAPIASTKNKIVSGVQNRTPNDQHYDGEPGIDPKGMPGVWREEWDRQGGHPVFVFQLLEDLWMQSSNSSAHISIVVHDRLNELGAPFTLLQTPQRPVCKYKGPCEPNSDTVAAGEVTDFNSLNKGFFHNSRPQRPGSFWMTDEQLDYQTDIGDSTLQQDRGDDGPHQLLYFNGAPHHFGDSNQTLTFKQIDLLGQMGDELLEEE